MQQPLLANEKKPAILDTKLSDYEQERVESWNRKYPYTIRFIREVVEIKSNYMEVVDECNKDMVPTSSVLNLPREYYAKYLQAAIADKLTVIRAIALLGHYLKEHGVVFKIDGDLWEQTISEEGIDLGLSIPAKNMGLVFLIPETRSGNEDVVLNLQIIYKEKFDHRFQKEVLDADLLIGYKAPTQGYCKNNSSFEGYLVTSDFYFSESKVGFAEMEGIGGNKRGITGWVQDILSKITFIEARAIESITVDPRNRILTVKALINTNIKNFESTTKYAIRKTR